MTVVEFPGLMGLKLEISRVAFTLFDKPIYWYGIIISMGLLLGMILALRSCEKFGISKNDVTDLLIFAVPSAIIMARLYYVAFKWEDFNGDILSIINIRSGGLAIYGGILGAVLSAYIFTKVRRIKTMKMFDFMVVYIPSSYCLTQWFIYHWVKQ
jgi:phosphatidylglycerol---prolipoprotein diacylglyceryl transferase